MSGLKFESRTQKKTNRKEKEKNRDQTNNWELKWLISFINNQLLTTISICFLY